MVRSCPVIIRLTLTGTSITTGARIRTPIRLRVAKERLTPMGVFTRCLIAAGGAAVVPGVMTTNSSCIERTVARGMEASRETRTDKRVDSSRPDARGGRAGGGARLSDAEEGGNGMVPRRRVSHLANGGGLQQRRRLVEGRLQSIVHVSRERLQTNGEEDRRQMADRVHLRDSGGTTMMKNSYFRHDGRYVPSHFRAAPNWNHQKSACEGQLSEGASGKCSMLLPIFCQARILFLTNLRSVVVIAFPR